MLKNKTHKTTAVRIQRGEYNFSIRTVPSDPLLQRHFYCQSRVLKVYTKFFFVSKLLVKRKTIFISTAVL